METEIPNYNGWANFATWNINLWMQNDEGLYNHALELMRAWKDDSYGILDNFDGRCAEEIARELFPSGRTPDNVRLNQAEIDWTAIADAMLELLDTNEGA